MKILICKNKNCKNMITGRSITGLCASCAMKKVMKDTKEREKRSVYNLNKTKKKKNQIYRCKKCKKIISRWSAKFGSKMCASCFWTNRFKDKTKHPWFNKHHKEETKQKISNSLKGIKSNLYIHGRGYLKYSREFTKALRKEIRERDKFVCQCCGMTQEQHLKKYNRSLEIHHIDHDRYNCSKDNLITTCKKCNSQANFNIDYWYAYYTYKLQEIK